MNIIKFICLIFTNYELFSILTNKDKKLSIIGTIVIGFSTGVQLNLNYIESLIIGELIVILLEKMLTHKNQKLKIILSILIIISSIIYGLAESSYKIAFGYIFLSLIIWILLKNKEEIKKNKVLSSITFCLSIVGLIIAEKFNFRTPTEDVLLYRSGISNIFNYLYNLLLPYNVIENKALYGSIISLFPLPMLLALYYIYKNEKHSEFLLPVTFVAVIETVFCASGFVEIIENITLFSKVTVVSSALAVNFANLLIIFYFLGNIDEKFIKFKNTIKITIVLVCILVFIERPAIFSDIKYLYLFTSELCLLTFLFLNYDDKKYKKVFLFFLCLITLIGGIPVNFL